LDDASVPGGKRIAMPADFLTRYDATNPEGDLLEASDFEMVLANKTVIAVTQDLMSEQELEDNLLYPLNTALQQQAKASADQLVSKGRLSLDLNKFLRVGDTLQVVYRRIH
jgi:hypothetical protein